MNKPKTNIYDIDGKLIRKAGDNHQFTIEECQERIKYYLELLKALTTEDPDYAVKASTYNQYVDNLVSYCIRMKMVSKDIQPKEQEPMDNDQIDIVDLEPQDGGDEEESVETA